MPVDDCIQWFGPGVTAQVPSGIFYMGSTSVYGHRGFGGSDCTAAISTTIAFHMAFELYRRLTVIFQDLVLEEARRMRVYWSPVRETFTY